jgi:L-threonylcarbamoyladenylate synthase
VPEHLSHLDGELGYRVPAEADLRALLKRTGPLVAPSANPEGAPPAADIAETRAYFGNQVDLYVDGGRVTANKPSRIIRFTADGASEVLR